MPKIKTIKHKRPVGAPPTFATEDEFLDSAFTYLEFCDENREMPNIAGFCTFVGIWRDVYYDYRPKFPNAIKRFEDAVEDTWVKRLAQHSCVGAIFYLKNAFREHYRDTHDMTTGGKPIQFVVPQEIATKHAINDTSLKTSTGSV